jgi:hypothetical protein
MHNKNLFNFSTGVGFQQFLNSVEVLLHLALREVG